DAAEHHTARNRDQRRLAQPDRPGEHARSRLRAEARVERPGCPPPGHLTGWRQEPGQARPSIVLHQREERHSPGRPPPPPGSPCPRDGRAGEYRRAHPEVVGDISEATSISLLSHPASTIQSATRCSRTGLSELEKYGNVTVAAVSLSIWVKLGSTSTTSSRLLSIIFAAACSARWKAAAVFGFFSYQSWVLTYPEMGNSAAGPDAGSRILRAPIPEVAAVTIGSPRYAASIWPFCQAGMMFWNVTWTYLIFFGSTLLAFRTWVSASSWKLCSTFTLIVLPSRSFADLIGE